MKNPEILAKVHNDIVHKKAGESLRKFYASGSAKAEAMKDRIRSLNPTSDPNVRAKISITLRRIHHKPPQQGGNGRPMPLPQKILLELLGEAWVAEYAISLGKRTEGYPTCYKVDLGNPSSMIAIEIDGFSHVAEKRKFLDMKKEDKLNSLGWKVLRFTNKEVLSSALEVVGKVQSLVTTCK